MVIGQSSLVIGQLSFVWAVLLAARVERGLSYYSIAIGAKKRAIIPGVLEKIFGNSAFGRSADGCAKWGNDSASAATG